MSGSTTRTQDGPVVLRRWRLTPATLFNPGDQGGFYNVAHTASLWQDEAGTIPVTADGDPVRRVDDLSGQGNHLTPIGLGGTYHTDGSRHWLLSGGNGTADRFRSPVSLTLQSTWTMYAVVRNINYSGAPLRIGVGTSAITIAPQTSANRIQMTMRLASKGVGSTSSSNNTVVYGNDSLIRFASTPGFQSLQQNDQTPVTRTNLWFDETNGPYPIEVMGSTENRWYGALFINRELTAAEQIDLGDLMAGLRDGTP